MTILQSLMPIWLFNNTRFAYFDVLSSFREEIRTEKKIKYTKIATRVGYKK